MDFGLPHEEIVERWIRKARIVYEDQHLILDIKEGDVPGAIVKRNVYDQYLRKGNESHYIFNTKITDIYKEKQAYIVRSEKGDFSADIIVHAAGANARDIDNFLNIKRYPISHIGTTLQYVIDVKPQSLGSFYSDGIDFHVDPERIGAGYIWIFPRKDTLVMGIGAEVKTILDKGIHLEKVLNDFARTYFKKNGITKYKIIDREGAIVPFKMRSSMDVFLVGDALGAVNLIHGGGIYQARKSGVLAAQSIVSKLKGDREAIGKYYKDVADFFENYERKWDRRLKKDFKKRIFIKGLLNFAKNNRKIKEAIGIIYASQKSHRIAYTAIKEEIYSIIQSYLDSRLKKYIEIIDKGIHKYLDGNGELDLLMKDAMDGGRRLRSALTLIGADMWGINQEYIMPVAIAYEMSHTASLLHDDVIDNGLKRRGKDSFYIRHGLSSAITVGDALLIKSFEMLSLLPFEKEVIKRLIKNGTEVGIAACKGEIWDSNFTKKSLIDMTIEKYIKLVSLKTGSLIEGSFLAPAIIKKLPDDVYRKVLGFANQLGIAFQIYDDSKDVYASEDVTKKTMYNDLKVLRATPMLIYTYRNADEREKRAIFNSIGTEEGVDIILKLYKKYNALSFAKDSAKKFLINARNLLYSFPNNKARGILEDIVESFYMWSDSYNP